jgi:hypothetical protein
VDDGFAFFLGQGVFEVPLFARRRWGEEVVALIVVFAGVEVLGVAAGAFARGADDEAAELVEKFGFLFEGQVGGGDFEEGLEELEGEDGFDGVVEGRDA